MELLGYIAEHGEVDSAVTQFVLTNVTFVNGAEDGYLVYSELEEQERLQRALIEDYPDVQVEIDSSIPPQLKIHFNFSVDEQLPAKALEAAQRVYELVKDGSTDTVRLIFTEEKHGKVPCGLHGRFVLYTPDEAAPVQLHGRAAGTL